MKGGRLLIIGLVFLLMIQLASADTRMVSNSADWKDVYSTLLFASLQETSASFLTSARHSTILLYSVPRTSSVEIISSRRNGFVVGYRDIMIGRGYNDVTEYSYDNVNLELAKRLENIDNFIVIDPSYGYNAISAAPYAALTRSYVLFADRRNIRAVSSYLDDNDVNQMLLFGQLDREVKDALAKFNPDVINEGDRFDNNIAINRKFLAINPKRQVTLTNGEFIEAGLMTGFEPVVYIGRTNVPDQVRRFIQESDIEVGVLVGNELIGTATYVRRQLGISVFVKFAQGSRTPSGSIAPVEDLDRFPMPRYNLNIDAVSMVYNRGTNSLEVTFRNLVDLAAYLKSTITITDAEGVKLVGDDSPVFLDGESYKTMVYSQTSDGEPLMLQGNSITGRLFTIFGEGQKSMEFTLEKEMNIDMVTILDNADIEIEDLVYNNHRNRFEVKIQSTGTADAYVNVELVDLVINDELVTAGSEVEFIKKGRSAWLFVPADLSEQDIIENQEILVRAYYGERDTALVKLKTKTFLFKEKGLDYVTYGLALVLIALIILFLLTKKKCRKCGHKNPRKAEVCQKCGARLKNSRMRGKTHSSGHSGLSQHSHTHHSAHNQHAAHTHHSAHTHRDAHTHHNNPGHHQGNNS